jgi:thioredoxin reductase (NADPH)
MERVEVLIIGAGPIGLEVGFCLRAVGIEAINVDAGEIGHTIATLFPPATRFFSSPERLAITGMACPVPSQEKITGEEYLAYLLSVVVSRGLVVRTFQRVTGAAAAGDGFDVTLVGASGIEHRMHADKVVLACGGTHRPRTLGVSGETLPHVHNALGDPHRFFGRRLLVIGGRNAAVESALRCWRAHADVAISYRGNELHERVKYWLRPEVVSLIKEGRIKAWMPTRPVAIEPGHVVLERIGSGDRVDVEVDEVLLQIGYEQDDMLFQLFGVRCEGEQHAPVFNADTMETNVPGVFVAGTAIAGTQQRYKAYIETSHGHGPRIAAALTGAPPPPVESPRALPEG